MSGHAASSHTCSCGVRMMALRSCCRLGEERAGAIKGAMTFIWKAYNSAGLLGTDGLDEDAASHGMALIAVDDC